MCVKYILCFMLYIVNYICLYVEPVAGVHSEFYYKSIYLIFFFNFIYIVKYIKYNLKLIYRTSD